MSEQHFRLVRPDQPALALGMAVNHLMTKPAFAKLKFGDWSKVLVGQINRRHFASAVDAEGQIQGFVGWALTTAERAEAWLEGRALSYEESLAGDCVVFNAWSASTTGAQRFLVEEARKLVRDKQTMYFRRAYADGSHRPVRLPVNQFVAGHVERHMRTGAMSADD